MLHTLKPKPNTPPLVEIWRTYDEQPWQGYVVARSDAVVVIHQVSDRLDLNGYTAFNQADIESMDEWFEERDLLERALHAKQQAAIVPPDLDVSSMKALMDSAQRYAGIIMIERELAAPEQVEVGIVRLATDDTYVLRWMSEFAEWINDDRAFRYADVTRVEFGDEYSQTLLALAEGRSLA
jgi:hypothetical protein